MSLASELAELAVRPEFQARVRLIAVRVALEVIGEDLLTVNHANRAAFSAKILDGSYRSDRLALAVVTRPQITQDREGVTDAEIRMALLSVWNAFSG